MSDGVKHCGTGREKDGIKRLEIQEQYEVEPNLIKSFQIHAELLRDDASDIKLSEQNCAATSWTKHGGHAN